MKYLLLDYLELWLSASGLILIWVVPYFFAPAAAAWKVAALTAATVSTLYGVLFWAVRRRRETLRARTQAEVEAHNEMLEEQVQKRTTALEAKTQGLRELTQRIQSAREKERVRIAREVHDVLGQALTGLQFDTVWLSEQVMGEHLQKKLKSMERVIEAATQTVQEITTELRPGILDELGIVAALDWQTRAFAKRTGLRAEFCAGRERIALSRGRATAVFRIVQEALTNVSRHAEARRVKVHLTGSGSGLVLTVEDDGRGITAEEIESPDALGILGMQERAAEWSGTLRVERSTPQGSTRVTLRMPLEDGNPEKKEEKRPKIYD